MGSDFSGLDKNKKSHFPFVDCMTEPIHFENGKNSLSTTKPDFPKTKNHATRNKTTGKSQKSRPIQAEHADKKLAGKNLTSDWKKVSTRQAIVPSLVTEEKPILNLLRSDLGFEGFKAGGSGLKDQLVEVQASEVLLDVPDLMLPQRDVEMGTAFVGVKNNEMQPQHKTDHERWPLLEISNDSNSFEGNSTSSRKIVVLEIPKGLLKRIDPSLQSKKTGKEVEEGGVFNLEE